jgi:hypothetical protein
MACSRCGGELKDTWRFCPMCGAGKGASPDEVMGRDFFSQLLSGFKDGMGKDGSPFAGIPGQSPGGPAFTGPVKIKISATDGRRPGPAGVRVMDGDGRPAGGSSAKEPAPGHESLKAAEPQVRTSVEQGRTLARVFVPGVKSAGDVSIKELESSVEVRAVSSDTLYFRILKKPPSARITGVSFSGPESLVSIRF